MRQSARCCFDPADLHRPPRCRPATARRARARAKSAADANSPSRAGCPNRAPDATASCTRTPAAPAPTAPVAQLPVIDGLHDNDAVAVCGDSITEQKRYSVYMEDYLLMCKPKSNVHAMQFGWGGEVVGGFLGRMSNVLRFPVTVATTFYGMNDGGYAALTDERAKLYRDGTKSIVDTFKKSGVRFIVVGSPGVVDSKTFRPAVPEGRQGLQQRPSASSRDIAGRSR